MKIGKFLFSITLYILILLGINIVHAWYFPVSVVFYDAILDACIAVAVLFLVFSIARFLESFSSLEKLQTFLIFLLIGYIYAISIPTVIDRSLSFYILEKIDQRGGGVKSDALEDIFTDEYVREHRLIDVRLTEQLQSGTIEITNECVMLTDKGRLLARLSRFYRQNFLPKKRLLRGELTDELTDPFRHSKEKTSYKCP